MAQNNQALKVALAAVQQLSLKQQKQLAERLISSTMSDQRTTVVYLHRLSPQKQARLTVLMDKHSENRLSQSERRELNGLALKSTNLCWQTLRLSPKRCVQNFLMNEGSCSNSAFSELCGNHLFTP